MDGTEWRPDYGDESRFTEGDCMILARAIQKLTGWPIYAFDSKFYKTGDIHVFNVMPDGRIIDILGVHEPKDFVAQWKEWACAEGTYSEYAWKDIRKDWKVPAFGKYSYTRARVMARRLLDHYNLA